MAAVLAVLLAMTASVFALFQSSAHAAINPRITISDLSLVISSPTGQDDPSDNSSRVDDIMRLSFSWDATGANPTAGDSFRIGLPDLFRNREHATQDLKVTHGGKEHVIGQCVLGDQDITCTFNAELDTLKGQGFSNARGTGSALLQAVKATQEANASIDANGTVAAVPIPGGSIADNTGFHYVPETLRKWSSGVTNTSTEIPWELSFGFPGLQNVLRASGQEITVDGHTSSTIVMTDEISPGQEYPTDKSKWQLAMGTSKDRAAIYGPLTDATGQDLNTDQGDYDLQVEVNGNRATITASGPFQPDTNYHVYYSTIPTSADHAVQPGVVYTNHVTLQGTDTQSGYDAYYIRSFNINVELQPGFGGFKATKLLGGTGAPRIPTDTTFDLTVDYALPGGATTDTYAGWTAPGTVNPDKTGGRTTLKLTAGQSTTYDGTFPAGTVLTLSEDTASASSTPQGLSWAAPSFTIDGTESNTVTIEDQLSHTVQVKNTAEEARTGQFSISKTVKAEEEDFSSTSFTFAYRCSNGAEGELQVPGTGALVTSPELPAGTTCEITEDVKSAAKPGFSLAPSLSTGSVTIKAGEVAPVTATNTYSSNKGTFTVAKAVTGSGSFGSDVFEIRYRCTPPEGQGSPQEATLRVTAGGKAESGPSLPTGTTCEISEPDATKSREGHSVATTITVDGTAGSTVTIARGQTAAVSVTNTYTALAGSFQVTKTVAGGAAAKAPASFTFDYTCTKDDQETAKGALEVKGGESKAVSDVPAGSSCTVTEKSAQVEGAALTTVLSVDGKEAGSEATFEITNGATVAVAATNTYERTTGTFSVVKEISDGAAPAPLPAAAPSDGGSTAAGAEADAATAEGTAEAEDKASSDAASAEQSAAALAALREKEFSFTYTCEDPDKTTGTVKAKGDGTPVEASEQLPVGTVCTVTEDAASAEADGFTLVAPEPQKVTIGAGNTPVEAYFLNTYTPKQPEPTPTPSPSAPPVPSPSPTCVTPAPSESATPGTPGADPSASGTPGTTPSPLPPCEDPAPSQSATPGTPGADPGPSHTCLTPAPSASGTPEAGSTSPAGDPSSSASTDPCAPAAPHSPGSSLARTGASLGAVLVAVIGLVGGAALLSHRRRV